MSLIKRVDFLGDRYYVLSEGSGYGYLECLKNIWKDITPNKLSTIADLYNRCIVEIDNETKYVREYCSEGAGYIFLIKYDDYTYGLCLELTLNNEYRSEFTKECALYDTVLLL